MPRPPKPQKETLFVPSKIGQQHLFAPPASVRLTLADKFLVPPFTTLDARAGYWQDRKREWLNLGIEGELAEGQREVATLEREGLLGQDGREDNLLGRSDQTRDTNYYRRRNLNRQEEATWSITDPDQYRHKESELGAGGRKDHLTFSSNINRVGTGTSIFDPVLCELVYRWFVPPGGLILDPFAGGSVRGVVAGILGRRYLGVDLRPEQVAANQEQAARLKDMMGEQPTWVVNDSREELKTGVASVAAYDFVFSCPPYFDLERYSKDRRDLSNATSYLRFREAYFDIVKTACGLLRNHRFACFVVGEVRAKDGTYVGLVPDTIVAFREAGLKLYNEAVLLTSVGSLPVRVSSAFGKGRKLGKSHQNVLVFVKGDPKRAAKACGPVAEVAVEQGGALWKTDESVELPEYGERLNLGDDAA